MLGERLDNITGVILARRDNFLYQLVTPNTTSIVTAENEECRS